MPRLLGRRCKLCVHLQPSSTLPFLTPSTLPHTERIHAPHDCKPLVRPFFLLGTVFSLCQATMTYLSRCCSSVTFLRLSPTPPGRIITHPCISFTSIRALTPFSLDIPPKMTVSPLGKVQGRLCLHVAQWDSLVQSQSETKQSLWRVSHRLGRPPGLTPSGIRLQAPGGQRLCP